MSTTIMNAITNLDLTDYDEIDTMIAALKERKKTLRTEKSALAKAEKAAEKALEREAKKAEADAKKAEKAAEKALEREAKKAEAEAKKAEKALEREAKKAETAAAKATMKTLEGLQKATLKSVKRETEGPPKPKNASYQNFCKWSKGDDAPSEEEVLEAGGRRAWLKKAWGELTKEAQNAPDAPWNSIA
jgi:hypothetical protein